MTAVLGLDPAWGTVNTSGVALVARDADGRWRFLDASPSYARFCGSASSDVRCDPQALLDACSRKGHTPHVVSADIPLARVPITGRRPADDAISREFGGRGASAHSPSAMRPGAVGTTIAEGFAAAGYPLATAETQVGTRPVLIETYPHPALITLLARSYRLQYKVDRRRHYWRALGDAERIQRIKGEWRAILERIGADIANVTLEIPSAVARAELKGFEDMLDALVTCWVGTYYVDGRARALGDARSAIWVPVA